MFCPNCKSEYVGGIKTCSDCNIPLVDSLEPEEYLKFITVFQSSDPGLLAIVKSILEDSRIEFFTLNENVQDFIGGRLLGLNSAVGPVEIKVSIDDFETVKSLLQELS